MKKKELVFIFLKRFVKIEKKREKPSESSKKANLFNTKDLMMIDYIAESKINYRANKTNISSATGVYEELKELGTKSQEHFTVCYLDGANNVIENRVITIGTLNQSLVHPREVFAPAIELRAASIILAHNHPSGVLKASHEDIEVTKRLLEGGKILGIEVLDHLIITNEGFISLKDEEEQLF